MHLSDGARFRLRHRRAFGWRSTLARATEINRELWRGAASSPTITKFVTRSKRYGPTVAALDHVRRAFARGRFRAGHGARPTSRCTTRSCELDVVKRTITISIEQLSRPSRGIATYVRGLRRAARPGDPSLDVVGLGQGATVDDELPLRGVNAPSACGSYRGSGRSGHWASRRSRTS